MRKDKKYICSSITVTWFFWLNKVGKWCVVCESRVSGVIFQPFFRLDALAKALSVIATATWLGGWLAVTLRYCIKTAKRKTFSTI